MRRARGFLVLEVLCAIALIVVAALIWVSATARVRRAEAGLADGRDATYAAEQALLALRSGVNPSGAAGSAKIAVESCDGGAAVAGSAWVYVEATVGRQKGGLVGLVPTSALKRGEK